MNLTLIRDLGVGRIKHFDTAKLCRTASAKKASKKGLLRCYSLIIFIMVRGYLAVKGSLGCVQSKVFCGLCESQVVSHIWF